MTSPDRPDDPAIRHVVHIRLDPDLDADLREPLEADLHDLVAAHPHAFHASLHRDLGRLWWIVGSLPPLQPTVTTAAPTGVARSVPPTRTGSIVASVKKTNRLVSVEEGWPFAGIIAFSALAVSVLGHTTYYFLIQRYEANLIAPLNYTQMIGSVIVGYLMFSEVPDLYVWLGTALIVLAGLMVGWSGRKRI